MVLAMASLLNRILSIFGPAAKSAVTDAVKGELQRRDTVTEAEQDVEPTDPPEPGPFRGASRPPRAITILIAAPGSAARLALGRCIAVGSGAVRGECLRRRRPGPARLRLLTRPRRRARPR